MPMLIAPERLTLAFSNRTTWQRGIGLLGLDGGHGTAGTAPDDEDVRFDDLGLEVACTHTCISPCERSIRRRLLKNSAVWASPRGVEGSVRNPSTPGGWNGAETSPEAV